MPIDFDFTNTFHPGSNDPAHIRERLELQAYCGQKLMEGNYRIWHCNLRHLFGDEVGEQLGNQQLTIGMTLEHLKASFGPADQQEEAGPVTTHIYGNKKTGSYFDVQDGVIIAACIQVRPLPPVPVDDTLEMLYPY